MKKSSLSIGLVSVLAIILFFVVQSNAEEPAVSESELNAGAGIEEGKRAKEFSLVTIERNTVKLSDYRGKYVLFASMATWCTPCQIEAQNVKKAQENSEHIPLVVMQIDVDQRETAQDLQRFRQQFGREDWIMGFDDGSITSLYNIKSFDTTIIVNPEGSIVYRDNGFPIDTKTLEDLLIKGESSQLKLGSTHEHSNITVILGGSRIDFSDSRYQLRSSFVHFEGGDGKGVHVHAKGVTLKYLFETLGWEVVEDCLATDTDEYCSGSVLVDGRKADFNHEIKEGEVISVDYR